MVIKISRVLGFLSTVAAGSAGVGACGPEENVGLLEQPVHLGDQVTDNVVGTVAFGMMVGADFDFRGSGTLYGPDNAKRWVITAGHVGRHANVAENPASIRFYQSTCEITDTDAGCLPIDTRALSPTVQCVIDPTFGSPKVPYAGPDTNPYADTTNPLPGNLGRDLAFCRLATTIPESSSPLEAMAPAPSEAFVVPSELAQEDAVSLFGFGPNEEELSSSPAKLDTYATSVLEVRPVTVPATGARAGWLYVYKPKDVAGQYPMKGDSGGSFVFNDGSPSTQIGVHISRLKSLPFHGVALAIDPMNQKWLQYLAESSGVYLSHDVNQQGRLDHVIVHVNTSPRQLHMLIVHGEGHDVRYEDEGYFESLTRTVPADASTVLRPVLVGRFNAGDEPDLVLRATDGRAYALYDVYTGTQALVRIGGTQRYGSLELRRYNRDFDDIRAVRVASQGGGTVRLYGSPTGLKTPISDTPGTSWNSCRYAPSQYMDHACGSRPTGGTCWCDGWCTGVDCCNDFQSVCVEPYAELLWDAVALAALSMTEGSPFLSTSPVERIAPVVRITSGALSGLGLLMARNWVLTSANALEASADPATVSVEQENGAALEVSSLVRRGGLALMRVDGSAAALPAGYRAKAYEGALTELSNESGLTTYGLVPGQTALRSAVLSGAAWVAEDPTGLTPPATTIVTLDNSTTDLDLSIGAPVMTATGELAGLIADTEVVTLPMRAGIGLEFDVPVKLHHVEPLNIAPPALYSDKLPAALQWVRRIVSRSIFLDGDGDGIEDLWGSTVGDNPALVYWPLDANHRAGSPVTVATLARTGNWQLVGRGQMLDDVGFVQWREMDTGEMVLWKTEGLEVVATQTSFVDTSWEMRGIGDIDGDYVDDVLLESQDYQGEVFWQQDDMGPFDTDYLEENLAAPIRYAGWFGGLQESDAGDSIDLVAAGHFPRQRSLTERPETNAERGAVDLVWQNRETGDLYLSDMASNVRTCDELDDPRMFADCEEFGLIPTYEMHDDLFALGSAETYWTLAGVGDYNHDTLPDLVWQAGAGAPSEVLGHVRIWMSSATEGYVPTAILATSGSPLVLDPSTYALNIH